MSEEFTEPDMSEFIAAQEEIARWATVSVPIGEIMQENKALIKDMSKYDPVFAVPLLASLLTLPRYQSNCIRLEILVALAMVSCNGPKKANIRQIKRWFSQIGKSKCVLSEDQAEDVFVSLVQGRNGDFRLLEGVWEAAGFYTQRILEVVKTMPETGQFAQIRKSVNALLTISDMVCEKARLHRYQLGSDKRYSAISPRTLPGRNTLVDRVKINLAELDERSIALGDLEPFLFQPKMRKELPAQQIGLSYLDRYPLIMHDTSHLTVALPSAISVALRNYVIENIYEGELVENFNRVLSRKYSKLIFHTPLLGGPMRAPVKWQKAGDHQWSHFYSKIDEGYFISFHLFLPSVETHKDGGFKELYQDDGSLTEALQTSINEVTKHFEGQDGFKEGLVVLVGCGWGKGYATKPIELNHPRWRLECISAADLVRLSWLADMNPSYFWRIQDGLEAITKAGVYIVNPNGILNLIGWVRSNNGHFVPHEQLPEGEITPERPLMLQPPINLLREVRVDSDNSFDRHLAIDNTETWHDVQHSLPKPFFSSESSRRVYSSMDDVNNKTLTSFYEGTIRLWMSVAAPSISEKEIEFRLWEMVTEWLHRIGSILEERDHLPAEKPNFKVYVEFSDSDPPKEGVNIPTTEELIRLCKIEAHKEPNACKVVFQTGFLAGFRIAENVAERLVVRTLAGAYLHLLGVENFDIEAKEVESQVVPNNDARSFHIFQAQEFIHYVRDTLPENLITIDTVDDATTKIGLGWRVLEKGKSNKIEGREACTDFLDKVVDLLLEEIYDELKAFDRISTLKRLVANYEKAHAEKDHWRRTSAALLGLHGDKPENVDRYVEQMSKNSGASLASRVLIEIALCVCPVEAGAQLSDIELSKLIARAALLIQIGGMSDAIFYNALTPEIRISPLGDILFRDDFGRLVVEPMLKRVMGDEFITNVPLQRMSYGASENLPQSDGKVKDEFLDIWKIEMGFDLDQGLYILGALEDFGIEKHLAIFAMKQSAYIALVCSENVSEDAAKKFIDQFSLSTRSYWNNPPSGFNKKDIYPWRYGRRLSFATRPILKVEGGEDPLIIIAPGALREGLKYVCNGAYSGRFEQSFFRSKEMKDDWWGKAREGHTFNAEVAKAMSEAGWQVKENIGLPQLLGQKLNRNFGDIDVLAWRSDLKEVLVIECKDLSLARNYSEIAALLSDYQGLEVEGEADKLKKHLNRVALIQNKIEKLKQFTGIQEPRVISCLICSGVVPMQYVKIDALDNTFVGGISELLELKFD